MGMKSPTMSSTGHLATRHGGRGTFYPPRLISYILIETEPYRQVEQLSKEDYAKKAFQWGKGKSIHKKLYPYTNWSVLEF
jgi:hypothetical protein